MERCMKVMTGEMDTDQAVAVCMKQWSQRAGLVDGYERRFFSCDELRVKHEDDDEEKPMKIVGHAAVFDLLSEDLGWFREKIAIGAFATAIERDDVRALVNHDATLILGRNKAGTLRMKEDDRGLMVEIDPPDTQYARDVVVSIKRRDITQMSFGFQTMADEWDYADKDHPIRTLREVKLFDVSPVTFPAYPDTDVAARSLMDWSRRHEVPPARVSRILQAKAMRLRTLTEM